MKEIIYVKLVDEGIDVWQPVEAVFINEKTYRILDSDIEENAQFQNNAVVEVKDKEFQDGSFGLIAYKSI